MFGLDGLLDDVRGRLQNHVDRMAGVAYHEGMLYVAGLERKEQTKEPAFEVAMLACVMLQAEEDAWQQAIAEKTAVLLSRAGWNGVPVVFALDEGNIESFDADLPSSVPAEEAQQMAHYEAARQLHREPDAFFSVLAQADGRQTISVLDTSDAEALQKTFAEAGVELWGIAAPPAGFCLLCAGDRLSWGSKHLRIGEALLGSDGAFHDWNETYSLAIYGPALMAQAIDECGRIFPLRSFALSEIAYGRVALVIAALWLTVLAGLSAWDGVSWYGARQEAQTLQAQLALLGNDAERMKDERAEEQWTEKRENALRQLTEERAPVSAVLIHLGRRNVDGVRLDAIVMKQGKAMELAGQAVTFDALSDYLQGFERDRAFFPSGPTLLDASRSADDEGEAVHFSMEVELPAHEDQ
ncbi:hypothetical protein [uncultured Selenomonas sp.]|uniref:hypothetical protein n=1 Tax=uncultured Selenomonas sp. TaxID=159275 RepID=UPI0025FD351A|nr:hypothetical protein [uncultured Selenomonas sp.]